LFADVYNLVFPVEEEKYLEFELGEKAVHPSGFPSVVAGAFAEGWNVSDFQPGFVVFAVALPVSFFDVAGDSRSLPQRVFHS